MTCNKVENLMEYCMVALFCLNYALVVAFASSPPSADDSELWFDWRFFPLETIPEGAWSSESSTTSQPTWGEWSSWTNCSDTCNQGFQVTVRECTINDQCPGDDVMIRTCNVTHCTATSGSAMWSEWSSWTECNAPCENGTKLRTRTCLRCFCSENLGCVGNDTESDSCNTQSCPEDTSASQMSFLPVWLEWGSWTDCNHTCGEGLQMASRNCTVIGQCAGDNVLIRSCSNSLCTIDNGTKIWSSWSNWTDCNASCGGGIKSRMRTCLKCFCSDDSGCGGNITESDVCNTQCCPVTGLWSNWGRWSRCSVTCKKGIMVRERKCRSSCPSENSCRGKSQQRIRCDKGCCPKKPKWSKWTRWTKCSVSCGRGLRTRHRKCQQSACPDWTRCQGKPVERQHCHEDCCSETKTGRWSKWNKCSKSCGRGEQIRKRTCKSPGCPANMDPCTERMKTDRRKCNLQRC